MQNNHELEDLEEKITRTIRTTGSYSLPVTAVYEPAMRILEQMVDDGLVTKFEVENKRIYKATSKIQKSILVREIVAEKVRVGHAIGQRKGEFIAKITSRSKELQLNDINFLGVVCSVETRMFPRNLWEKITFKKGVKRTVISFKNSKIIVDPSTEFLKVKS
jgi:hypothetical protein